MRHREEAKLMRLQDDLADAIHMLSESAWTLADISQSDWADRISGAKKAAQSVEALVKARLSFVRAVMEELDNA